MMHYEMVLIATNRSQIKIFPLICQVDVILIYNIINNSNDCIMETNLGIIVKKVVAC